MRKIAFVHTCFGGTLPSQLEVTMEQALGKCLFYHIGESRVFPDIMENGRLTDDIEQRMLPLFSQAQQTGADIVICTCSSVGKIAERAAEIYSNIPTIRIDAPAAQYATDHFDSIGIMASVETTLLPSLSLVNRLAAASGRKIHVDTTVATGALELMFQGKVREYEERILSTVQDLATRTDVILLAQASLAPLKNKLQSITGKQILATPEVCAEYLRNWYAAQGYAHR